LNKRKKILFIGGSLNQTTMLHKVSGHFPDCDCYFSSYYTSGYLWFIVRTGIINFTILGGKHKKRTDDYISKNKLNVDYEGRNNDYDLVVTCSDLIIPKNIRKKKIVLVQEGMTDLPNVFYYLSKYIKSPRYFASTSTTGMSDAYIAFCVASEGYKEHFVKQGCKPEKIYVTGIPNFDNCVEYLNNDFPHKDYVLVCTSDSRETWKYENRKKFIRYCREIANGKQLIFKLHPNESSKRAAREIKKEVPDALVYSAGNTNEMVANCSVLITTWSTVVYVGLVLGKEVYSSFDLEELKKMVPLQNGGISDKNIAEIIGKFL
jgi:hypothetical protein